MTKPSWQDFGTHDESAVPELWDGVVGAWAPCLGPTGSRLHDMSRRSNWGTLTNMDNATDWVLSDGQYALDFDGSNDVISVPNDTIYNTGLTALSIHAWIKIDPATTNYRQIIARTNSTAGSGRQFGLYVHQFGTLGADLRTSTQSLDGEISNGVIAKNRWVHVMMSWSAGVLVGYVDGVRQTPVSISGTLNSITANISIGAFDASGTLYSPFWGQIDDLQVLTRGVTPQEASLRYQLGRGGMYQRRRRRAIYLPQAGFQAAWARGSNALLGFNQP